MDHSIQSTVCIQGIGQKLDFVDITSEYKNTNTMSILHNKHYRLEKHQVKKNMQDEFEMNFSYGRTHASSSLKPMNS